VARKNDSDMDKILFQMDRLIQQNGEWFYMTREGDERGPFITKEDAEGDIVAYIMHRRNMEEFGQ
jgi:hypothetical protein